MRRPGTSPAPAAPPATHLLDVVVLAEQGVGAVGDAHGDDAHGADHDHGHVDVGEHGHHRRAQREAQRPQHVDDPDAQVVVVQVLLQQGCGDARPPVTSGRGLLAPPPQPASSWPGLCPCAPAAAHRPHCGARHSPGAGLRLAGPHSATRGPTPSWFPTPGPGPTLQLPRASLPCQVLPPTGARSGGLVLTRELRCGWFSSRGPTLWVCVRVRVGCCPPS